MIYNTLYLWFVEQLENKCPPPQTDWKDFQNKNTNAQTKTNASTGILHITVLHLIGRDAPMQGRKLILASVNDSDESKSSSTGNLLFI